MKRVRYLLTLVFLGTWSANVCAAQPHSQIATTKNNGSGGAAVIGGAPSTPGGKSGKPRFPIIPSGTVLKSANPAVGNAASVASQAASPAQQQQVVAAGAVAQGPVAQISGQGRLPPKTGKGTPSQKSSLSTSGDTPAAPANSSPSGSTVATPAQP